MQNQYLTEYLQRKRAEGLRPATLRMYAMILRPLDEALGTGDSPGDVPAAMLLSATLRNGRGPSPLAPATQRQYLGVLVDMLRNMDGPQAATQAAVLQQRLHRIRGRRPPMQALTKDQYKSLLAACGNNTGYKALIQVLVRTGLRSCEVAQLASAVLQSDGTGEYYAYTAKGGGPGRLYCTAHLRPYLREAQQALRDMAGPGRTQPWPISVSRTIKRVMERAGLRGHWLGAHTLRRTCATWAAYAGINPVAIQKQLRHARLSTTTIYIKTLTEQDRRLTDQFQEAFNREME